LYLRVIIGSATIALRLLSNAEIVVADIR